MISNVLDRVSFWCLFLVIVLLPIFFLPFMQIPVETSKGLLLVIGSVLSFVFWAAARFSDGKIILPRSSVILAAGGILLSFLLSSIFSPAVRVSLFGTMLDTGTFYFMLAGFLLLLLSSVILKDPKNARVVFWGVIASSIFLLLFQSVRFFFPEALSFGVLGVKTSNILGSWNAFGIFAGFSAILSVFVIEFFPLSRLAKWFLGVLLLLSLFVSAAVNLLLVWILLGVFALLVFIYKLSFSYGQKKQEQEGSKAHFPLFSFVIVLFSLLFFMSSQFIGAYIPERLGLNTLEIGPSVQSTFEVGKGAISENPLLGTGPNRFGEAWIKYKPESVNTTIFWNTTFDVGSGLIPTFFITTGVLGIISWIVFFYFFVSVGMKSLFASIRSSVGKEMAVFFVLAFYLFVASIFYATGPVILLLSLAFTGAFAGLAAGYRKGQVEFTFLDDPRKSFFSILVLVLLMLISAAAAFKYIERFASITYFERTLSAQEIPQAENSILRAVTLYSNDLYLRTYSQVYLSKINNLVTREGNLSEEDRAALQASFDEAIGSAQLAAQYDSTNYLNFSSLGSVYNTVGAFGVEGAYERALEAYTEASRLNPKSPGLKLALARVSFASGNLNQSVEYGREAISLKPNYIEALLVLSQVEQSRGNISEALSYAETALSFSPTNRELIEYVSSLRNRSSASPNPPTLPPGQEQNQ